MPGLDKSSGLDELPLTAMSQKDMNQIATTVALKSDTSLKVSAIISFQELGFRSQQIGWQTILRREILISITNCLMLRMAVTSLMFQLFSQQQHKH